MIYKGHDLDLRMLRDGATTLPVGPPPVDAPPVGPPAADAPPVYASTAHGPGTRVPRGVYKRTFAAKSIGGTTIWVDETVMTVCNQAHDLAATLGAREIDLEHLLFAMTQIAAAAAALDEHNIHVSGLRSESSAGIVRDLSKVSRDGKSAPRKSDEFESVLQRAAKAAYTRRSPVAIPDIIEALFDMSRDIPTRRPVRRRQVDPLDMFVADGDDEDIGLGGLEAHRRVRASAGRNTIARQKPNGVSTLTDTVQNSRLAALERAIRELTQSMEQGLPAGSIHRADDDINGAGRPDYQHDYQADIDYDDIYRLFQRMERRLETRIDAVLDRVGESGGHRGGIDLPRELEARFAKVADSDQRLEGIEVLLKAALKKIDDLEGAEGSYEIAPVLSGLRDVEAGLRGIAGQLREVDQRTGDVSLLVEGLGERQERIETRFESQQDEIVRLGESVRDEISGIGSLLVGGSDGGERMQQLVEQSLAGMTTSFERQQGAIAATVNGLVAERFAGLAHQMRGQLAEIGATVNRLGDRAPATVVAEGGIDSATLDDAVTRILQRINALHHDSQSDLAALQVRIDGLERQPATVTPLPNERFEEISERLRTIQDQIPHSQPTDVWSRFKMWLFGTRDWYAASWESGRDDAGEWRAPGRADTDTRDDGVYRRAGYDRQQA